MRFKRIVRLFEKGNVSVDGLRGTGKDMLMANVVVRRKLPYVSNTYYGGGTYPSGLWLPFDPNNYTLGGNSYENFLSGDIHHYEYPHPDGFDLYISDAGVYFPSQYCGELNKKYGYLALFMALTRQLGECNFHTNTQNLNRVYDKIREQSDIYIKCNWCKVIFGFVLQQVTIYDCYESCVKRVPPFRLARSLFSADRKFDYDKERLHYEISYGKIARRFLFYRNKSCYNTRRFKEMLEHGTV